MGYVFQAECWGNHPSVGAHLVYYGYGNWQRQWKSLWKGKVALIYENNRK